MKIIHTADWHIGKILYGLDLIEDHELFFDWLTNYIVETQADVLLVSGDIFDHSNPTNDAQKTYYKAITKLQKTGIQIVLTGGNHDSALRLNSSEDLLNLVGIDIVGGVPANFDEQIIPLRDRGGEVKAICGAVPFLKDKDIKEFVSGETSADRVQAIRSGILNHYVKLKQRIIALHGDQLPIVAMGHLFMQGAKTSEEEREIQLGNQAGLDVANYNELFDYFALGHIHIPQKFGNSIRYSGSPIPLDFTEYLHEKLIIEVSIDDRVESKGIKVPKLRNYYSMSGTIEEIKNQISELQNEAPLLPVYYFGIVSLPGEMGMIDEQIEEMKKTYLILGRKFLKNAHQKNIYSSAIANQDVRELDPTEVFMHKLTSEDIPQEQHEQLILAYQEIVNSINQAE